MQHVRLLDRQVFDSARTSGLVTKVVTLTLSTQTIRRDLPSDTYFDVSFSLMLLQ